MSDLLSGSAGRRFLFSGFACFCSGLSWFELVETWSLWRLGGNDTHGKMITNSMTFYSPLILYFPIVTL